MTSTLSATKFTAPFVCAWLVLLLAVPVYADLKWKLELPGEVEWSKVVWTGSLLVGAKDHITLISPDGSLMWSRTDLKNLAPFNVQSVPGSDAIVVSELVSKIPMRARLSVLNLATGETRWKTDPTMGSNLGGYPIPERDLVLFARDMQGGQGVKAGANLSAFNLNSGEVLWTQRLGSMGSLPSHISDSGGFIPTTDLSGHPPPVIQGDLFIWQAGDLFAVDLTSGELRWRYKLKAKNPQLKNAFARPIVADGVVYAVGTKKLVSLNLADGSERWVAKLPKAPLPQLELIDDLLVVRLGGTFSTGKKIVQQKPFGVAVVDREDGAVRWSWKRGKGSVTNVSVIPDANLVVLADRSNLYTFGLDATEAAVLHTEKLDFKRKMGKAEIASKGLGAAAGFLGGGGAGAAGKVSAFGGAFGGLGGGGDRLDPPLDLTVYDEQIVVRGQYHVLAFDHAQKSSPWSIQFEPPGVNSLALIAAGAVTTVAALGSAAQGRYYSGSDNQTQRAYLANANRLTGTYQAMAAERFAASEKSLDIAFFLTKDESIQLVGIDLTTGNVVGTILMPGKQPLFTVDAVTDTVFYFAGDNNSILEAHSF